IRSTAASPTGASSTSRPDRMSRTSAAAIASPMPSSTRCSGSPGSSSGRRPPCRAGARAMIAVLIINHRTAAATARCVDALMPDLPRDARVLLLDNGSGDGEVLQLANLAVRHLDRLTLTTSTDNLGFAAGMNRLLRAALADANVGEVVMLNS